MTAEDGGSPPQPGRPGCEGTAYSEPLPTKASLDGLSFSPATAEAYLSDAFALRFPLGHQLFVGGHTGPYAEANGNCFELFVSDTSTAAKVLVEGGLIVHECGHFLNLGKQKDSTDVYVVRGDLTFTCSEGDTTDRYGKTFARSLIREDSYAALRPVCAADQDAIGCDFYRELYLAGDATDATVDNGDMGYNLLLEEALQYVNQLATALAFEDAHVRNSRITERDGVLTLLWYIERYLKLAREEHPDAYAFIQSNACWRQLTLTIWDRAWFYLNATRAMLELQVDSAALETLVGDKKLVAEIDALRESECR
jgi:hypothetical protein